MLDQATLPWFAELNRSLTDQLDDDDFRARMRGSVDQLRALAGEILVRVIEETQRVDGAALRAVMAEKMTVEPAGGTMATLLFAN